MLKNTSAIIGHSILIVEDVYFIAMDFKLWLEGAGATVVGPVPDIKSALDLIDNHNISGALLDINLYEREEVYPVADRLSQLGIPFVFVTGHPCRLQDTPYRDAAILEKPCFKQNVLDKASEMLGERIKIRVASGPAEETRTSD